MAFGLTNTDNVQTGDVADLGILNGARASEFVEIGANGFVYAGNRGGIVSFAISPTGTLDQFNAFADTPAYPLDGVGGLASAVIGTTTFLFAATGTWESGVAVFSVDPVTGALAHTDSLADDVTLALSGATGITTAVVGGTTYLFVASQNEKSVTVFSVDSAGLLTYVEEVLDGGGLRLDAATDVATAVVDGTTYLIASGYLDGISVFSVDTNGHLVNTDNQGSDPNGGHYVGLQVEAVNVDGNTYVISSQNNADGLSVFSLNAAGQITEVFFLADDGSIALTDPVWLKTEVLGGVTYLFVASQSDTNVGGGGGPFGAVSVWTVNADGSLTNVANVYDDATVYLGLTFSLGVGFDDGTPYLLAQSWGERGLSLFELTPPSPPDATNMTRTVTYNEDDGSVALDDIVVTDPDTGETITARLTLSNIAAGALTTSGTATYTPLTGIWTITGTVTEVNTALAAVSFTPAGNNDVDATITTHIEDAASTGPANGLITLDVTPANDAPGASDLTQTKTYTEGDASVALDDIVVSEVDTDPTQTITATLTLTGIAAGVLTTSGTASYTPGTGIWTITGTVAQVNAALAAVAFTPATNNDVDATITTHIQDQDSDGPADGLITLDVTPVNDAPTASNLTDTKTYTEGDASVDLSNIVVTEVDTDPAQTIKATLTLANAAAGVLTTAGGGSYTPGTGIWIITGTVAQVNAALAAVAFTPATDNDADATITTHIEDQNSAGPANGLITLDVTPVNDAPAASNLTQTKGYTEGAASVALDDIVVTDPDTGDAITATLTLSNTAVGVLTTSGTAAYTAGTGVWTITGTVAQVNAALAAVAFTPATNNDVDATISTHIEDQNAAGPANGAITLDVTPENDAPVAQDGSASGAENAVINGTLVATDIDSLSLTYSRVTQAAHGSVTVNPDGTFSYTPDADYDGPDSFTYKANDGSADSNNATVDLTVSGAGGTPRDFNGDATSDVLWRHTSGFVSEWQMSGGEILNNLGVGIPSLAWRFQDTGDFNADGRADILWRHDNGQVVLWEMDGSTIVSNQSVGTIGNDWHNEGVGDFNGDGRADALWHNDNGQVALWTMDGAQITDNQQVAILASNWHFQGLLDANGDGKSDVLLRDNSGQVVLWTMDGAQITGNQSVANLGLDWNIVGTGDFGGDGRDDVLLRNDSGQVVIWEMNGNQIVSNQSVATPGNAWQVQDVGDYNSDGRSDVLWRNDSGQVAIWDMNGAQITNNHAVASLGFDWVILNHRYDML